MRTHSAALALLFAFSTAAWAQQSSNPSTAHPSASPQAHSQPSTSNPSGTAQSNQNATLTFNTVKADLEKAGFTNIELVNAAYLVQATSKDGNKVVMMINPPNFSAVEAVNPKSSNNPGYAKTPGTSGQSK